MHDLVEQRGSLLLIATHSPILMAYPGATIYQLDGDGIGVTRDVLVAAWRIRQLVWKNRHTRHATRSYNT